MPPHPRLRGRIGWPLALALGAVVVVAVAGALFHRSASLATTQDFPVAEFQAAPESLAGNRYKIRGRIEAQVAYDPAVGRVMVVETEPGQARVPIVVPASVESFVPQRGQVWILEVRIGTDGVPEATGARKL